MSADGELIADLRRTVQMWCDEATALREENARCEGRNTQLRMDLEAVTNAEARLRAHVAALVQERDEARRIAEQYIVLDLLPWTHHAPDHDTVHLAALVAREQARDVAIAAAWAYRRVSAMPFPDPEAIAAAYDDLGDALRALDAAEKELAQAVGASEGGPPPLGGH